MALEIERKFLVTDEFRHLASSSDYIVQGYIFSDPKKSVRVRLRGNKGYITVKSSVEDTLLTRNEWEYEIPANEVNELLRICDYTIEKTRYVINYKNLYFEIDEFYGQNEGLLLAEVELKCEAQQFSKPPFLGEDVTNDPRYINSQLAINPFRSWPENVGKFQELEVSQ